MANVHINFRPRRGICCSVNAWFIKMLHHFFEPSHHPCSVKLLLLFSLAVAVEGQSSCVPRPVSLAIGNVSVANGRPGALARGIAIDIGSPPQSFAFLPDALTNSFVYAETNFCSGIRPNITDDECITIRGGAYHAAFSKTHKTGASDDTVPDPELNWTTKAHNDIWKLNEQVSLEGYTFEIPLDDSRKELYKPQALLGLGRNSTLLQVLRNNNLIASRSWSYFWGLDGRGTAKTNGSLVLGGYDQDKVSGTTKYTAKLNYTTWCTWGTQVEISDMKLDFPNSTTQTLFGDVDESGTDPQPSLPLYACIDPGTATMFGLPYVNYMKNFVEYTDFSSFNEHGLGDQSVRSLWLYYWNLWYLSGENPYTGGISVDIKGGPSISVLNDQLVVPHVYMDSESAQWQQDKQSSDLLICSGASTWASNQLTLGRYFMTNLYIMVNLDAGEFTIWTANSDGNNETLVAVDGNGNVVETSSFCPPTNTTIPASDPQATATTDPPHRMATGSIVGIAIGCAAALGMIGAGIWWFLKRRKPTKGPEVNDTTTKTTYQASWATASPPLINDPNKHNGSVGDRSTMLSSASFLDANHPSGTSNPSELSSNTPTYAPHHELQG